MPGHTESGGKAIGYAVNGTTQHSPCTAQQFAAQVKRFVAKRIADTGTHLAHGGDQSAYHARDTANGRRCGADSQSLQAFDDGDVERLLAFGQLLGSHLLKGLEKPSQPALVWL